MRTEESFLRLPAVQTRVPFSKATIYRLVAAKQFPAPINLGERAVGWLSSDIDAWIAERIHKQPQAAEAR